MSMVRKQIYLPKDLDTRLKLRAKQENKPTAQVIREAIEKDLKPKKEMTTGEALLGLAELGEKLNIRMGADASSRIDDILYGDKD